MSRYYTAKKVIQDISLSLKLQPEDTTASVQGFGHVAQHAIRLYHQIGGKTVCVSCWDQDDQQSYAFRKAGGIDPNALLSVTDRFGTISRAQAEKMGYEQCDHTVSLVPGGKDYMVAHGLDERKFVHIPNGFEPQTSAGDLEALPAEHSRVIDSLKNALF